MASDRGGGKKKLPEGGTKFEKNAGMGRDESGDQPSLYNVKSQHSASPAFSNDPEDISSADIAASVFANIDFLDTFGHQVSGWNGADQVGDNDPNDIP